MTRYSTKPFMLALVFAAAGWSSSTVAWEMTSYQDFLRGRFDGVSLTRDGSLLLAPELATVFSTEQPVVWSMVQAADGTLYAGTGHRGRVLRIEKSGQGSVLWTADQPEVFALALDPKGVLYAATSPKGKVYRIENGKASEYFAPDARYIWAMAFAPDGALYLGTGDQGKIYRVEGPHKGDVYYDTGQSHVTCLAFDAAGQLLAGTEPNGILYRISAKDKAFVLYDANLAEIHTIVPAPDGTIYAAAMGSSAARRILAPAALQPGTAGVTVTASSTSVTVADDAAQGGIEVKPKPETLKAPQPAAAAPLTAFSATADTSGLERSALYAIHPDNTVETLWSSKEESIYDLLKSDGRLLFSTDGHGRVYQLNPDRKVTLLVQTNEGEATRLLGSTGGLLAATGDMGKIFRLGKDTGVSGSYEAPVHDSGTVARWGRLSWRSELCDGCSLSFRTRSGNSARPDKTWSDWSEPLTDPRGSPVTSPNARFIEWTAQFAGAPGRTPVLDAVTLAYLPQNGAPVLKSIVATSQFTGASGARAAAQAATAAYSITVTDTGESSSTAGTSTQPLSRSATRQVQITWQAEDPDGDRMVYALYYRGEDEREWKLLKDNLQENTYTIDSDTLADGRYFFKAIASDSPSNPPATARQAEIVSSPVLIDNTPPIVTAEAPRRSGSILEAAFEAVDAASPLRRFEYSLDAGPWVPMEPTSGIIDSQRERFQLRLDNLAPGEHVLVVRATDANNNVGLTKVVVR
jgi:hypothetical protein